MNFSRSTKPALLTPEDLGKGEEIMEENFLDLYPDPAHFVQYVKSLDRLDMAAELFVRLLEVYHSVDTEQDADPSRCADVNHLDTWTDPSSEACCIFKRLFRCRPNSPMNHLPPTSFESLNTFYHS